MKDDQRIYLTLSRVPGCLTVEQAAWELGRQPHEIPILVANGLLKPLGNPPACAVKFFAAVEILERKNNLGWLAKATNAIHKYWKTKNSRKRNGGSDESQTLGS